MAMTVVSATVVDSDGQAWMRGSWRLELIPALGHPNLTQYQVDGTSPLSSSVISQNGVMDNSGLFSVTLYDNTTVTPSGSSWKLTICPLSSASCGFYTFSASGASLNISGALTFLLPPPRFLGVYPNFGYADFEVTPSNHPGSTYYNVIQQVQKYYNDQTQTWAIVGTGPAGAPGTPGTPGAPGAPSATPPIIITATGTDLNTITTSGVYYFEQGTGANTPNPPYTWNSDMCVLEVFAHLSPTYQYPYIVQRMYPSENSFLALGSGGGDFFIRYYFWNGTATVWSSWYRFAPIGTA